MSGMNVSGRPGWAPGWCAERRRLRHVSLACACVCAHTHTQAHTTVMRQEETAVASAGW